MFFNYPILFGCEYEIQIWSLLGSQSDKIRLGELSFRSSFDFIQKNYLVGASRPDVIPQF